jgi:hypothetical protein
VHQHDQRLTRDGGDRRNVAQKSESKIVVERRVDRIRGPDQQQRISVGRCAHDRFGGEVAGSAGPVLDDDRLPQPRGKPLRHQARQNVVGATGRKADNEMDRACRIGLCACSSGYGGENGASSCEAEKPAAAASISLRTWAREPPTVGYADLNSR